MIRYIGNTRKTLQLQKVCEDLSEREIVRLEVIPRFIYQSLQKTLNVVKSLRKTYLKQPPNAKKVIR